MNIGNSSRRQFLVGSVSGLSSAWLELHWPTILAAADHARHAAESGRSAFEFFTSEQATEVEAVAAQIIPSNDTPGARDAAVIHFIDRALTSFDRDKQGAYTRGLSALRMKVHELFAGIDKFADLNSQQQIQLLTAIENTEFFEQVRVHTIMGFLAKPSYGGNQNQVGWNAIGFEDRMTFAPPFGYYDREYRKSQKS
jgi:gluconate 2-dehydrogenase gamma chain